MFQPYITWRYKVQHLETSASCYGWDSEFYLRALNLRVFVTLVFQFMRRFQVLHLLKKLITFSSTLICWYYTYSSIPRSIKLAYIFSVGFWAFANSLDVVYKTGIDPLLLMKHKNGFQVSAAYDLAITVSILTITASFLSIYFKSDYRVVVGLYILFGIYAVFPYRFSYKERYTIMNALYKSIFITRVDLSQVLLCDILTSYSRVVCQMTLETVFLVFPEQRVQYYGIRGQLSSHIDIAVPVLVA